MKKLFLALMIAANSFPALATVLTYNVSGQFTDGAELSGSFSFDNTGGIFSQFSNINVLVDNILFSHITSIATSDDLFAIGLRDSSFDHLDLGFAATNNNGALVSITGTSFAYSSSDAHGSLAFGSITSADVPEPAMLGLFGLGAIGLGLSRRRKAA